MFQYFELQGSIVRKFDFICETFCFELSCIQEQRNYKCLRSMHYICMIIINYIVEI